MDTDYNLGSLVEEIKDELQDESYNDSRIIRYINRCYFEVFGEVPYSFFEKTYKYETIESGELQVPKDFGTIIKLVVEKNGTKMPLKYLAPREFFADKEGIRTYRYTIIGNVAHYSLPETFDCTHDSEEDDFYTLKMYYLAKPAKLEKTTDKPLIPSEYAEILVLGALAHAERRRGNFDFAQIYDNQKAELITNMAMRYGPRQLDEGNRGTLPVNIRINEV